MVVKSSRAGKAKRFLKGVACGVAFVASSVLTIVRRADGTAAAPGGVFYVAPDGANDARSGSREKPFATITYAAGRVPDGSTILVRPGTYRGRVSLDRGYPKGLVIRSEVPYQAVLRNRDEKVIRCYGCQGITLEGFDVAHDGPGAAPIVVQIDGDGGKGGRDVVLRNNILHDSFRNDILKINNGARGVRVQGNIFYNQASKDEHIDANSVADVIIEDNVFFNDYAGAQRITPKDSASFIVIKDSNDDEDGLVGSENIRVRRNVFAGWQGGHAYGFVLVGEDGKAYFEARDVTVENNLFLGDSSAAMRSPFGVKGGARTLFRNNTVLGDLPGRAFATRINREGNNRRGETIRFYNNVWDDPTGTMRQFSNSRRDDVASFELSHNLYWNGGARIPVGFDDVVNYTADRNRVVSNPGLPDPRGVVLPRWVPEKGAFADGSTTIEQARGRLIDRYARPATARAVMDRADSQNAPDDDIRGKKRGKPDIGAFEVGDLAPRAATLSRDRPRQSGQR